MNAPLPESVRKALETATLDDKYSLGAGRAFMSGVQALRSEERRVGKECA